MITAGAARTLSLAGKEGLGVRIRRIAFSLCFAVSLWAMAQSPPAQNAPAQNATAPKKPVTTASARFLLELGGKQVGKADYQFTPTKSGFHVKAHYDFATGGSSIEATREAELGPDYDLRSDSLAVHVNGVSQSVSIKADPRTGKLTYAAGLAGGSPLTNAFDLHPGTVVLNNFDPSGAQGLIYLDAAHSQPEHKYWALLAQGKGVYLPVELRKLGLPALVLRGVKDIQVSEEDFQALARADIAPGSESREIEGLNHLMMPVAGDSTGQEYFQPAHVAPEVIRLIADWIATLH
jgi:hypothetical protein